MNILVDDQRKTGTRGCLFCSKLGSYFLILKSSWQPLQEAPSLPNCSLAAAASPVAATLAISLASLTKAPATLPTPSLLVNSSGLTRVSSQPLPLSVPGRYSAPMPEPATAWMALAALITSSLL